MERTPASLIGTGSHFEQQQETIALARLNGQHQGDQALFVWRVDQSRLSAEQLFQAGQVALHRRLVHGPGPDRQAQQAQEQQALQP